MKIMEKWENLPTRDEALAKITAFVVALSSKELDKANSIILVKDINVLINKLHDSILSYLDMVIDDEQWYQYEEKNLAYELTNPEEIDEEESKPEFSGKTIVLSENEEVSIQLAVLNAITPIRVHFKLVNDDGYLLQLFRITADGSKHTLKNS
ncbi:MAG: hypothetical protein SGJ04_02520 [Bacteroidota bacterium]|nr:hypothetical protein [Bacteroidota bacterium]